MLEDKYSFTGKDPGKILWEDTSAKPFDYEEKLREKGYTNSNPPDLDDLLHAFRTEYIPDRVITVPKIVEVDRLKVQRTPDQLFKLDVFMMLLPIIIIVLLVLVVILIQILATSGT
jgi:hypothetical protein